MTSTIITNKVTISIAQNKVAFTENVSLEKGTCLGVHFIPFFETAPNSLVEISLQDAQSNVLINPVDYRDYQHKGGGYLQGIKQLGFPTSNTKVSVNVNAVLPLNQEFQGQLVFVIQREKNCDTIN